MLFRLTRLTRRLLLVASYSAVGSLAVLIIVFIAYLENRPNLSAWHITDLNEEFTVDSAVETFSDYLALEDRLFAQLDELVYTKHSAADRSGINRYNRGSLSDPKRWSPNWNHSFVLEKESPKAAVLLLHGMSDSPYSLRSLGQRLNSADTLVLGLRIPGHGTAPSGLVEITWEDMAAAVQLAMRYLASKAEGSPLYIVGYSNGAALAVHYTLATLEQKSLPMVEGLVLLSPAIGVTSIAKLAVWQARLGHLLGLEKLAWNAILPEYDPFKYGSFAVNAGDVVYRLTSQIQEQLDGLSGTGSLKRFPAMLAFSSVVDATVETSALVDGLFKRLPGGRHELVLFDINRVQQMEQIMKTDPSSVIRSLRGDSELPFTLTLVTNETPLNHNVISSTISPGNDGISTLDLRLSWPADVYSLSHVALPFPPNDPLYGRQPAEKSPGIQLGDIALRGERGVLQIPSSEILRLRSNPFFPYMESRLLDFLELGENQP